MKTNWKISMLIIHVHGKGVSQLQTGCETKRLKSEKINPKKKKKQHDKKKP